MGADGRSIPFANAPKPPPPEPSDPASVLGWMSALAIAAGIVCVMMGKVGQAIALILTGTALISLNIVLDDYRWLIGPLGLAFGVGAVALVAGQYLGFWNFKKKLVAEAEAPRNPMDMNEWTPQEKQTLATAAKEITMTSKPTPAKEAIP